MPRPTHCQFATLRGKDGLYYHRAACGLKTRFSRMPEYSRQCDGSCDAIPGPGDRLKEYLAAFGIRNIVAAEAVPDPKTGQPCTSCTALQDAMNYGGPEHCRQHRAKYLGDMRIRYDRLSAVQKAGLLAKAALMAPSSGLVWKLDLLDPLGSLYDLAVIETEREILFTASKGSQFPNDPFNTSPGAACPNPAK